MYLEMHQFFTHGIEYNEESCTEPLLITAFQHFCVLPALILSLVKSKSWGGWL
jgi:hypothetical protein